MNVPIFVEVELAVDVKKLIAVSPDVKIKDDLKKKINSFDDDDLLKVTKEIGSLIIKDAVAITDEVLAKDL